MATIMTDWTEEWPTKPGWYWFWGRGFLEQVVKLHSAVVREVCNGLVYVVNGCFLFEEENTGSLWCPAILPDLPED